MKSKGCSGWNRRNGDGMYILGMESSCDETSAAVVEMGGGTRRICSDIVASQIDVHRLYGGVVPEIASRAHIEAVSRITEEALRTAGVGLSDIGAIAVTTHPGLIGALLVGVNFAKSLAFANGIPLISVNHIHGHVAAAYLTEPKLEPPFLNFRQCTHCKKLLQSFSGVFSVLNFGNPFLPFFIQRTRSTMFRFLQTVN